MVNKASLCLVTSTWLVHGLIVADPRHAVECTAAFLLSLAAPASLQLTPTLLPGLEAVLAVEQLLGSRGHCEAGLGGTPRNRSSRFGQALVDWNWQSL